MNLVPNQVDKVCLHTTITESFYVLLLFFHENYKDNNENESAQHLLWTLCTSNSADTVIQSSNKVRDCECDGPANHQSISFTANVIPWFLDLKAASYYVILVSIFMRFPQVSYRLSTWHIFVHQIICNWNQTLESSISN